MWTPLGLLISCFEELQNIYENRQFSVQYFGIRPEIGLLILGLLLLQINQSQKLVYPSYCCVHSWVLEKPFTLRVWTQVLYEVTVWGFWPLAWIYVTSDSINYRKKKYCCGNKILPLLMEKHSSRWDHQDTADGCSEPRNLLVDLICNPAFAFFIMNSCNNYMFAFHILGLQLAFLDFLHAFS